MTQAWQVLSDCPHCRTEAAVVELMDPELVERRCRMCAWAEQGGEAHRAPEDLSDPERARAALLRWAAEEGEVDLEVFCRASFGGPPDEVVARLVRGEPVATSFDVVAFLFPGAGGGAVARAVERTVVVDGLPELVEAPAAVAPVVMDPRTPARVLVSVMVADGTLRAGERAFVLQFLAREGLAPLGPDDLRVWRPAELGPVPDAGLRERLLEAAVHLMHLDRQRDGSEWTVIREFARAWGVPDERLAEWDRRYDRRYTGAMARLGRLLERLF